MLNMHDFDIDKLKGCQNRDIMIDQYNVVGNQMLPKENVHMNYLLLYQLMGNLYHYIINT